MNQRKPYGTRKRQSRGFSTLELLLVMVVSLIIAAMSIPAFNQARRALRISGDARNLNGAINQAKMQAAADFTDARVYFDLSVNTATSNTFHVDVWNKALGCWTTVGDLVVVGGVAGQPRCIVGTSPVQYLSPGVTFGFGGVGAPPANTQTNGIAQGPRCVPVNGRRVGQVATTACVHFNSRGIPIDPATLTPTANDAVYITDNTQTYGVTVGPTGLSQVWANNIHGNANWYRK